MTDADRDVIIRLLQLCAERAATCAALSDDRGRERYSAAADALTEILAEGDLP